MKVSDLINALKDQGLNITYKINKQQISLYCRTNRGRSRKFLELPKNMIDEVSWLQCHVDASISPKNSSFISKVVINGAPINRKVDFSDINDQDIIEITVSSYDKVVSLY